MKPVHGDFAVLMSDFLRRCGRDPDPAADGIEFAAEDCILRARQDSEHPRDVLIEIELGAVDFETLADDARALLDLHRFNEVSDWLFTVDGDDAPVLRLARPIAETDGAMLERLFADGIETASAVAALAKRRDVAAPEPRFSGVDFGIIRG